MTIEGKQLSIVVAATVLGVLSLCAVALRCIARRLIRAFGMDDWIMIGAELFFIPTCVSFLISGLNGTGRKDVDLVTRHEEDALLYFFIAEPCYILTLLCVKTSICLTLLRIVIAPTIRYFLYFIMGLNAASNVAALVALFNVCHPIGAMWNPTIAGAKCNVEVIVAVGYFVSATSLVTDFSCAILPTVVLWNIQMNKRTKISVITILSLGFLASSATIVRLPGIKYLSARSEHLYHLGDIAIWTLIECGLGIIAGSIAMIKPLVGKILGSVGHEPPSRKGTAPSEARTTNSCAVDEIKTCSDDSNITRVELTVFRRTETAGSETTILRYP